MTVTGLTTTAALHELHNAIHQVIDTSPHYLVSPFISCYTAVGAVLYSTWIIVCAVYFDLYAASLSLLLGLISLLLLIMDIFLSYREKTNCVRDIVGILEAYNIKHVLPNPCLKKHSRKSGFYLNESYPGSTSVAIQRVYRNGKVVAVGRTLLVEGDIIVLSPGEEAPTHCLSIDGSVELKRGDMYTCPDKRDVTSEEKFCEIVTPKLPKLFTVLHTDYQTHIKKFLQFKKSYSKLTLEIGYVMKILHVVLLPVILPVSVGLAFLQWKHLSSATEIEAVLTTLLPLLPTIYPLYYTIAHHIATAFIIDTCQTMITATNNDLMKTPDGLSHQDFTEDKVLVSIRRILYLTYKILAGYAYRYLPRNSNIFDTLSAVTVLCTVNKEGILSRPNPNVERIMLLDPVLPEKATVGLNNLAEEEEATNTADVSSASKEQSRTRIISTTSADTDIDLSERMVRGMVGSLPNLHRLGSSEDEEYKPAGQIHSLRCSMIVDSDSKHSMDFERFSEYTKLSEHAPSGTNVTVLAEEAISNKASKPSVAEKKSKLWRLGMKRDRATSYVSKGSSKAGVGGAESDIDSPMLEEGAKKKKKKRPFWQKMKMSRYRDIPNDEYNLSDANPAMRPYESQESEGSLKDDFVVVLNVSLSQQSPLGLSFDYTDMEQLIDCLKPLGLVVLLNNMCNDIGSVSRHLRSISVQNFCGLTFKLPLPTDYCNCVIGREIGFTRSVLSQYSKLCHLVSYVPRCRDAVLRTQRNPVDDLSPLTSIVSSIVRDKQSSQRHLMSYGTAPFIMKCCYHYWNGKEVRPLQAEHRARILDFYNQNRLTSHCFVLAYRPLLDSEPAPQHDVFLALPKGHGFLDEKITGTLDPAENILKLQSGQTILGVMCAQFQPKHDIVETVESLVAANIRFVHFSYDNELRSRAFGTKLGLETGWNCHISLAEGDYDTFSIESDSDERERYPNYNSKARLPQGVANIRPHLEKVDNVPLLVPLFTSCTPPAIVDMISIMQEYSELVCCVGSSLQLDNFDTFLQADCSIGMIPHLPQQCLISGIKEMTLPWVSGDYLHPPLETDHCAGANCLHLTSILNTVPCSLVLSRDRLVIEPMIRVARGMSVALKQSGYLAISMYCALSLYSLIHQMMLLPPPISLWWTCYLCLFLVPMLAISPFTLKTDSKIMKLHTGKREFEIQHRGRHLKYFSLRWLTLLLVAPIGTMCTLDSMCEECDLLVGGEERFSGDSISIMQHYNVLIINSILCVFSFSFADRTAPLNSSYFVNSFTIWTAACILFSGTVTLLAVLISLARIGLLFNYTPLLSVTMVIVLPILQLGLSALTKNWDRRLFTRHQRRQKLQFDTKLGMNSPF